MAIAIIRALAIRIHFGLRDMVDIGGKGRCQSTLGGTGLAISAACQAPQVALEYAMFSASPLIQRTLFFENGGQPRASQRLAG